MRRVLPYLIAMALEGVVTEGDRRDEADVLVEWRYDEIRVDLDLKSPTRLADGSLVVEGRAAVPGVLTYRRRNGTTHREYVPASTLTNRDSLETLKGVAVTLEHPPEDVTPSNRGRYGVGYVKDVRNDANGAIVVTMVIKDARALKAVEGGVVGLSPGYRVRVRTRAGRTADGNRYDAIQEFRSYNHVAIVADPRGGTETRLRRDSDAALVLDDEPPSGGTVDPEQIKALIADVLAGKITIRRTDSGETRLDAGDATGLDPVAVIKALAGENATQGAEIARLTTALDEATKGPTEEEEAKARKDAADANLEYARARMPLLRVAGRFGLETLGEGDAAVKIADAPNVEIAKAILARHDSATVPDGSDDAVYIGVASALDGVEIGGKGGKGGKGRRTDAYGSGLRGDKGRLGAQDRPGAKRGEGGTTDDDRHDDGRTRLDGSRGSGSGMADTFAKARKARA